MRLPTLLLLLPALVATGPAKATLYLCKTEDGGKIYQDEPCAPDKLLRSIEEDPKVNVLPFAPASAPAAKPARRDAEARPAAKAAREARAERNKPAGNAEERRFIREGMEETEVLLKIGPPNARSAGPAPSGRGKAKRWVYMPVPQDPDTITTVLFQQGKVVAVERKVSR